jgi:hypothetical protein
MAKHVADTGSTCWLADRHEAVAAAVAAIEEFGGSVGRVVPLRSESLGMANCLHPDEIECWQAKGYTYRRGFCPISKCCVRGADPEKCPFLKSIDDLKEAESIVVTKALGQRAGFFSTMGNPPPAACGPGRRSDRSRATSNQHHARRIGSVSEVN